MKIHKSNTACEKLSVPPLKEKDCIFPSISARNTAINPSLHSEQYVKIQKISSKLTSQARALSHMVDLLKPKPLI